MVKITRLYIQDYLFRVKWHITPKAEKCITKPSKAASWKRNKNNRRM